MKGPGFPVWEDLLSDDDRTLLEDGVADGWTDTPDVLVVGAGVVGLAVAALCRRAGMRVCVLERARIAAGASGRAAGGLGPDVHPELGEDWHRLARESLALHQQLDSEWDYGLRPIDVLVPPEGRIPDQAHVDPLRFAIALARRAGGIATRTECEYTLTSGGRIVKVRTSWGEIEPGAVVFATGSIPSQVTGVAQGLVKGHLIATEPASFELGELVSDGNVLVVQLRDGRLVAGGTKDRDDTSEAVNGAVVASVERLMRELVPRAEGLRTTHAWCCWRPCCDDELPVVDRVPGSRNAWFAGGLYSTGILMAPIIGRSLSEAITKGARGAVEAFGLARLSAQS